MIWLQRYYTSVVGVKKKNQAGVFKGLAKRISQARLFLSEIIPVSKVKLRVKV